MILRYVVLALLLLASCHAAGGSVEMSAELTDETMAGESASCCCWGGHVSCFYSENEMVFLQISYI